MTDPLHLYKKLDDGPDLSFSPEQERAIKIVDQWVNDPHGPQVFRVFGFAGTGKTTIAKRLAQDVKGLVLFACFTGKAALVLRKKGCHNASTIHSLIYRAKRNEATGEMEFELNRDGDASNAKLIIIDEVSMVGEQLAKDLLSFGKKILVLGDPAQLPPINGEGFFINAKPNIMLTEVHRQARENPIIRMSMDIREGLRPRPGQYGDSLIIPRESIGKDEMRELVIGSDQLLCGLNKTRTAFNRRIRELKGLHGKRQPWHPTRGDRLICLKNNREKNIFNGGLWEVDTVKPRNGKLLLRLNSQDEPDRDPIDALVFEEFFNGTDNTLDWRRKQGTQEFTFGWAITCHKSQGSQFDCPIIFDESAVFRDSARNWLYTAVTRAVNKLTLVV